MAAPVRNRREFDYQSANEIQKFSSKVIENSTPSNQISSWKSSYDIFKIALIKLILQLLIRNF